VLLSLISPLLTNAQVCGFVFILNILTAFDVALHYAAEGGSAEAAQLLLENGAQVDAVDDQQLTPLHIAGKCKFVE
jgi:hypothetical protein